MWIAEKPEPANGQTRRVREDRRNAYREILRKEETLQTCTDQLISNMIGATVLCVSEGLETEARDMQPSGAARAASSEPAIGQARG